MRRILVTGAGGFLGSHLARELAGSGQWAVTGTWHRNRRRLPGKQPDNTTFRQCDFSDREAVDRLFAEERFDAVIHAAAWLGSGSAQADIRDAMRHNVCAQANVVTAARNSRCTRFVYCSTISVYGTEGAPKEGYREDRARPTEAYGWSKRAAEQLLDIAVSDAPHFSAVSLRFAGIHGAGRTDGALHAMTRSAADGTPIRVNESESRFRWVFLQDAISAVQLALEAERPGAWHRAYNVASKDTFSLRELAERIRDIAGSPSEIQIDAAAIHRNEVMNIDRIIGELGFQPTGLDEFLHGYVDTVRKATG